MLIQNLLQPLVQFFTLAEQIVQADFAQDRAQRRLRKLGRCVQVILYLDYGPKWVHHPKVNNSIDLDADVIFGDHILSRNVHGDCAQTQPDDLVDRTKHADQAWTFGLGHEPADTENHAEHVLVQNSERIEYPEQNVESGEQHLSTSI